MEVAPLARDTFNGVISESVPSRKAVEQLAEQRIAENVNGRNGENHA